VRIEDGTVGLAEQNLRATQKELADALDRNASEQEIQQLIDRLHQALTQYLSELSTRMAAQPGPIQDLSQMMGLQTNMLTPNDLDRMLEQMRNLSASGERNAAREELSKLQQLMENLRTERPQITAEQRQAMLRLQALRELTHQQQQLLDKTFQNAQSGNTKDAHKLASEQNDLLRKLQELMGGIQGEGVKNLSQGEQAMKQADGALQGGAMQGAIPQQNAAIKDLQEAMHSMEDALRSSMMMLPQPGMGQMGEGRDPFGRGNGMLSDDGSVKVPDQMEVRRVREILNELQRRAGDMNRTKTERDYIDRLLQNF
jgi:hypothetical protein